MKTGKDDAIAALKQSVTLDNPSDWFVFTFELVVRQCLMRDRQLLVELTSNND